MSIAELPSSTPESMDDLLQRLGGISPKRVRMRPYPGTATVADVVAIRDREKRLFELVDGVLVEKAMGLRESIIATALSAILRDLVISRNLGLVSGADGMMQLFPDLVRIPDVAFTSWARVPGNRIPEQPAPIMAPDLDIEVLSVSNTRREMARKLGEYLDAQVRLVWFVDLERRTVTVYAGNDEGVTVPESGTLDGANVLPGLSIPVSQIFAELDRRPPS
jgi:Uma2 family endonuclease